MLSERSIGSEALAGRNAFPTPSELPPPPSGKTGWPWTEESPQLPDTMPSGEPWPRVSIVTPSYNQGQFVEETLRSVLLQGYPDLEYIVMDGGSTDGSVEILKKYEGFLSYLHIGPDDGQAAAIGAGFRRATGEVLAWLNSDDYYLPGILARIGCLFAARPDLVFANGDVHSVDAHSQVIGRLHAIKPRPIVTASFGYHHWPQQGCFWRRSAYETVGGMDESLHFCMDRDLFIRLTRFGLFCRVSGPPLAAFRVHGAAKSSTSKDLEIGKRESDQLIKRYGHPKLRRFPIVLLFLWWPWVLSAYFRRLLFELFRWEL